MKILGVITVAILCIQFATSTPKSSQVIEADAVVELIGKRTKRSINTGAFDFHEIDLKISAFGITHEIALKSQPKGKLLVDVRCVMAHNSDCFLYAINICYVTNLNI